jgi:hypothetical protein
MLKDHMFHCHRRMLACNLMHVDSIGGDLAQVAGLRPASVDE